jgi:hypothetical protein
MIAVIFEFTERFQSPKDETKFVSLSSVKIHG